MKQLITSIAAALAVAATAHAGIPNYSMDRPSSESGRGFYVGAQGGVNLYQDIKFGYDSSSKVGGFGGLKFGYVMGTALDTVRPALELDGFYNQFENSVGDAKYNLKSGALLANGIVRFALGSFQPYIGVGVGGYTTNERFCFPNDDENYLLSPNQTGFAWQLIAGADYYITHDVSVFTEYKFLNYQETGGRLGQQLVGAGVRFHF